MLACMLLSVIMAALFSAFRNGMWACKRAAVQSDVIQSVQAGLAQLSAGLEGSNQSSLTLGAGGTSFSALDCRPPDGKPLYDSSGRIIWQRYNVVYHDGASQEIRMRAIPLLTTAPQRQSPGPIEGYDPGSGAQPLATYLSGGHVICRNVVSSVWTVEGARLVLRLVCQKVSSQHTGERLELVTSVMFRN
jgi:hypothetical protein